MFNSIRIHSCFARYWAKVFIQPEKSKKILDYLTLHREHFMLIPSKCEQIQRVRLSNHYGNSSRVKVCFDIKKSISGTIIFSCLKTSILEQGCWSMARYPCITSGSIWPTRLSKKVFFYLSNPSATVDQPHLTKLKPSPIWPVLAKLSVDPQVVHAKLWLLTKFKSSPKSHP